MSDDEPDMLSRLAELRAKADRGELTEEDREEIREMAVQMNEAMKPLIEATEEMMITVADAFKPMIDSLEPTDDE